MKQSLKYRLLLTKATKEFSKIYINNWANRTMIKIWNDKIWLNCHVGINASMFQSLRIIAIGLITTIFNILEQFCIKMEWCLHVPWIHLFNLIFMKNLVSFKPHRLFVSSICALNLEVVNFKSGLVNDFGTNKDLSQIFIKKLCNS